MKKNIIRAEYKSELRKTVSEDEVRELVRDIEVTLREKKEQGMLLTGGLFRWGTECFLYLEYVTKNEKCDVLSSPSQWFPFIHWQYMQPVFWTDEPKNVKDWKRSKQPEQGRGRIALLYPEKADSYVKHHKALVEEGLLVGDRYQFISKLGNRLFSYIELPRDNERVNLRRSEETSLEIEKWKAVDPSSHFYHFPEANGEDFLMIETLCWVH